MIQSASVRPNVLLMDDDLQCRRFMEVSLRKAGYCVLTAESESDALEKAFMLRPDAVLTDTVGPRVNGVALLERFESQADTKDIPFIFVTRQSDEIRPLVRNRQHIDVVDKPALMSEILAAVSRRVSLPTGAGSLRLAETIDFKTLAGQPLPFELDSLTDVLVPEEDWAEQRGRSSFKSTPLSTIPDFLFSKRGFQATLATSGLIALAQLLS